MHTTRDVIIVSDLFCSPSDLSLYTKLLGELQTSGVPEHQLWKLWHGDSHLIADDKRNWKQLCPTFTYVVDRMRDYFDMDIKATRFNWYQPTHTMTLSVFKPQYLYTSTHYLQSTHYLLRYRNTAEWKPFHHDAAAMKPDKARTQNFTAAVSFGCEVR